MFHNVASYYMFHQFTADALYLSPFLNAGATFACFQSFDMVPVSIDFVYILVKIGAA